MHNLAFVAPTGAPATLSGGLTPAQKPLFPPAVKSMRGTHLRLNMSALIITGVSTRKER
jgi:hypothetical protein